MAKENAWSTSLKIAGLGAKPIPGRANEVIIVEREAFPLGPKRGSRTFAHDRQRLEGRAETSLGFIRRFVQPGAAMAPEGEMVGAR
jgi:hypothetical protein